MYGILMLNKLIIAIKGKFNMGKKVELNTPAPDFELLNWQGQSFRLSDLQDKKHVVLIFNRGFM